MLDGDAGVDLLYGGFQNDQLNGGDGNGNMFGENDADILDGGAGDDKLRGGQGNDTFVFKVGNQLDRVKDWEDGIDIIDLTAFNFANTTAALAIASQVGANVRFISGGDIMVIENEVLANITADDIVI